jgi:hypothetical protein
MSKTGKKILPAHGVHRDTKTGGGAWSLAMEFGGVDYEIWLGLCNSQNHRTAFGTTAEKEHVHLSTSDDEWTGDCCRDDQHCCQEFLWHEDPEVAEERLFADHPWDPPGSAEILHDAGFDTSPANMDYFEAKQTVRGRHVPSAPAPVRIHRNDRPREIQTSDILAWHAPGFKP